MLLTRLALVAFSGVSLFSVSGFAQVEFRPSGRPQQEKVLLGNLQVRETTAAPQSQRTIRQQYLNELIAALQKAFSLSDLQLRRLRVASKGAVEYSEKPADQAEGGVEILVRGMRAIRKRGNDANSARAAANHPIWARALERVLGKNELADAKKLEAQQHARWHQTFQGPRLRGFRRHVRDAPVDGFIIEQRLKELMQPAAIRGVIIKELPAVKEPPVNQP